MRYLIYFSLLWLFACGSANSGQNWPQFRGPYSNPVVDGLNIPTEWDDNNHISWKIKTDGRGWSSPIIWDDNLFFTSAILDTTVQAIDSAGNPLNPRNNPFDAHYRMEVYCLDLNTGDLRWKKTAYKGTPRIPTHRDNTFASETPATDGQRIYAYFGMTGLFCYDFDGNLLWEKDMGAYFTQGNWGTSTSPIVDEETLFMQIDSEDKSYLVAIEGKSGNEIWRQERDEKSNWSTPIIWRNRVRTELVTTGQYARSYDPKTGALLWELNLDGGRNISSPVADEEMLYTGNEERRGSGGTLFAIKAGATGNITPATGDSTNSGVVWSLMKSGLSMASPLLYEDKIYIIERRRGGIFCYDAKSGKGLYTGAKIPDAAPFWSTPWAYKGNLYCLDEDGVTHVLEPGQELQTIRTNKLDDMFWTSPAFSEGRIVLRGVDYIYCIKK